MSVLLDGIADTHAREARKAALRRMRLLEARLIGLESSTSASTAITTGSGNFKGEFAALPPAVDYSPGDEVMVTTATDCTIYRLMRTTSAGAVDWEMTPERTTY